MSKKKQLVKVGHLDSVIEKYLKSLKAGRLKWFEKKLEEYDPPAKFPTAKEVEEILLRFYKIVPEDNLFDLCLDFVDWILRIGDGWQSWNEWRKVNAEIQRRKKIPRHMRVYLAVMD